jgi:hypothetical protein
VLLALLEMWVGRARARDSAADHEPTRGG